MIRYDISLHYEQENARKHLIGSIQLELKKPQNLFLHIIHLNLI